MVVSFFLLKVCFTFHVDVLDPFNVHCFTVMRSRKALFFCRWKWVSQSSPLKTNHSFLTTLLSHTNHIQFPYIQRTILQTIWLHCSCFLVTCKYHDIILIISLQYVLISDKLSFFDSELFYLPVGINSYMKNFKSSGQILQNFSRNVHFNYIEFIGQVGCQRFFEVCMEAPSP